MYINVNSCTNILFFIDWEKNEFVEQEHYLSAAFFTTSDIEMVE